MRIFQLLIITLLLFIGCGGTQSGSGSKDCSIEGQNRFLYDYMKSWYLWYENIPYIDDFSSYSQQSLLEKLKAPEDKWSFIMSKKEFDNSYNEHYDNYGLAIVSKNNTYTISYTLPNSPSRKAGIKRGDIILGINDIDILTLAGNDPQLDILKNSTIKLNIQNSITNEKSIVTLYKENYTSSPVLYYSTIEAGNIRSGYVVLNSFNYLTVQDLERAFSYFRSENVNNIIFDLRYNSGGLTTPISYIGYMLNKNVANRVAYRIKYNQKHSQNNMIALFENNLQLEPFEFDKIVFLTTKDTASASEMLINGLKPFVKTYIIGDNTHGKPVGMNVVDNCQKSLFPVSFRYTNANDISFGYDGLKADCYVTDDIRYSFGNLDEPLLKSGLNYLRYGTCNGSLTRAIPNTRSLKVRKYGVNTKKPATIVKP